MRIPDPQTIVEAAEFAATQLEQAHGKCDDMSGDDRCRADEYGDGSVDEHALYRRFAHALSEVE